MSEAVRICQDNFEILSKIKSKSERNALCFALIHYGFYGEIPQDLKLNENNLLLFEVLKNNFIAKKQGGALKQNNNGSLTVIKQLSNSCQTVVKKSNEEDNNGYITVENKKEKNKKSPLTPKEEKNKNIYTPTTLTSSYPKEWELSAKKFIKPTVDEVSAYCLERDNGVDAQKWFDFYTSKGWRVGSQPMKDWKAAVRTWERRNDNHAKPGETREDWYL